MDEAEGGGRVGWLREVEGGRFGHRDHGGFMDRPKRKELFELFAFWSVRESQGVREGSVRGSQEIWTTRWYHPVVPPEDKWAGERSVSITCPLR